MSEYGGTRGGRSGDESEGKLFVGGLAWDSTEDSIRTYFDKYGCVESVNLKKNKDDPSKHRGFCFIKFASQKEADNVLLQKEPHYIDGSKVDPKSACPAGVKPSQRTKKIFVGGLQEQTTEDSLLEYFGNYGQIQNNIEFAIDRGTQKRRGFCFIEFANEGIVDRIVKDKFHTIAGVRLETKRALTKQQQAEEAARQQSLISPQQVGGPATMISAQSIAGMYAAAGGHQQMVMPQYATQPVIYIHPDSLSAGAHAYSNSSAAYPNSTLAYQYATAGGQSYVAATGQSYAAAGQSYAAAGQSYAATSMYPSVATATTSVEALYQPYSQPYTQSSVKQRGSSGNAQRHSPYPTKKEGW